MILHVLCDRTYERRIETTGKKESDLGITDETFSDSFNELVVDVATDGLEIICDDLVNFCDIAVAGELSIFIVVSRREGEDLLAVGDDVLCFAGEDDMSFVIVAVVERTDTDRISCRDE